MTYVYRGLIRMDGRPPLIEYGGFDPAATTFFAAVDSAGGTIPDAERAAYNNMFIGLRESGLLEVLDRLGVFATSSVQASLIDLIDPTKVVTPVADPVWVANQGYTSAGAGSCLDIDETPTDMTNWAQTSAMFGCAIRNNRTADQTGIVMGTIEAAGSSELVPKWSDGNCYCNLNSDGDSGDPGPTSVKGYWVVSRVEEAGFTVTLNDSIIRSVVDGTSGVATSDLYVLAGRNGSGDPIFNSPDQVAMYYMGGGLTAPQISSLTAILDAYMAAVAASLL